MNAIVTKLRFGGRTMLDTLYNLVTGLGGAKDKSQSNQFGVVELNQFVAENMYRGDWIARKIVNTPAQDATREWRDWRAENDQIELIEDVERELGIQLRTKQGMVKARLYGGAALILGIDDGKDPSEELIVDDVGEGMLRFVHAVSRHELSVDGGLETDLMSPYFGEPRMYVRHVKGPQATPRVLIHPSRVIRIQGEDYPDPNMSSDGWGESVLQSVYDAVRNAGMVAQAGAVLIDELKVDVIKIPELTRQLGDAEATNLLTERLSYGMLSKSLNNALVMDKDDEWERVSAQLAGLPDVIKMYLLIAAGAADIPATRLLGQSPSGLNATGESDVRNYYDRIASDQENYLTPTLSRLDEVLIRSATGGRDENIYYEWNPLWQMNENELADIAKKKAEVFKIDVDMMLIPTDALAKARENTLIEDGTYPGIEIALEESDGEVINPKLEAQLLSQEMQAEKFAQNGGVPPDENGNAPPQFAKKPPPKTLPKPKGVTDIAIKDATPRTLYIRRDVLNAKEIIKWAKSQGFETTLGADDMHVTVCYSNAPVDWMKVGEDYGLGSSSDEGTLKIAPGGARVIEQFGEATVLCFNSASLAHRHMDIRRATGATWDYDEYQPHITISYEFDPVLIENIEPYRGKIELGPEIFEEVDTDEDYKGVEEE